MSKSGCRIGERSAHIRGSSLRYENVNNSGGSWTEWGNLLGVPIQR